jgi:hypothetical protein
MLWTRVHIYAASPFVHVYETKDVRDTAIYQKSASKFATESLVENIAPGKSQSNGGGWSDTKKRRYSEILAAKLTKKNLTAVGQQVVQCGNVET